MAFETWEKNFNRDKKSQQRQRRFLNRDRDHFNRETATISTAKPRPFQPRNHDHFFNHETATISTAKPLQQRNRDDFNHETARRGMGWTEVR